MPISTHVTVGTTATLIASQGGQIAKENVRLRNTGAASVFLGGANVTAGNGFEILAAGEEVMELGPGESLYGIVASGTAVVEVLANYAETQAGS